MRTFLQLLQTSAHSLVRPTDDINACDLVRSRDLQLVQSFEGIYAELVCTAEENP